MLRDATQGQHLSRLSDSPASTTTIFYGLVPSPAPDGGRGNLSHFFSSFQSIHSFFEKLLCFPFILISHQFVEYLIRLCGSLTRTPGIKQETSTTA